MRGSMAASSSSSTQSSSGGSEANGDGASGIEVETIEGDLVQLLRQRNAGHFVVHQANCVSKGARGLAKALFDVVPEANIYARRTDPDVPGTLRIQAGVMNLFGQYLPGGPTREEPASVRIHYFRSCLGLLVTRVLGTKTAEPMVLYFPHLIGCGLAGGDWAQYHAMVKGFAAATREKAW